MRRKNRSSNPVPVDLQAVLGELRDERISTRLWAKDPSLWTADPKTQSAIRHRLGWLDLPETMMETVPDLLAFSRQVRAEKFRHVVLLGMGGSSLCPEVLSRTFGSRAGFPTLHVLDTTDPATIAEAGRIADPARTLYVVSSKSGGTIEVVSLLAHFWREVERRGIKQAGSRFAAVTDPGTTLESTARARRFRRIFLSPPDVGGRFSALTPFGLLPAALIGVDPASLLARAARMARACGVDVPLEENPGVRLGAWMAACAAAGRDKLTLLASPAVSSTGLWIEQLIAESTGKQGVGILPVEGESPASAPAYGTDRCFVHLSLGAPEDRRIQGKLRSLEKSGHPVFRCDLADPLDLGAEFFRWEVATAVAGQALGINPFDEPNVAESKANTGDVLQAYLKLHTLPEGAPALAERGIALWTADGKRPLRLEKAWGDFLRSLRARDYLALMVYLPAGREVKSALDLLRRRIRSRTGAAVTVGFGPRFLHSTGQLHKGGPDHGAFIQITGVDREEVEIPGAGYGFSVLKGAQALGDFQALKNRGRRLLRIHATADPAAALRRLASLAGR